MPSDFWLFLNAQVMRHQHQSFVWTYFATIVSTLVTNYYQTKTPYFVPEYFVWHLFEMEIPELCYRFACTVDMDGVDHSMYYVTYFKIPISNFQSILTANSIMAHLEMTMTPYSPWEHNLLTAKSWSYLDSCQTHCYSILTKCIFECQGEKHPIHQLEKKKIVKLCIRIRSTKAALGDSPIKYCNPLQNLCLTRILAK